MRFVAEGIAAVGGAENRAAAGQDAARSLSSVSSNDVSGQMRPSKPSGMPMTFHLYLRMAALMAARMTALRPGASPPPVPMPMQSDVLHRSSVVSELCSLCHSEQREESAVSVLLGKADSSLRSEMTTG